MRWETFLYSAETARTPGNGPLDGLSSAVLRISSTQAASGLGPMSLRVLITRNPEDCRSLQELVTRDDISIEAYPVLEFEAVESGDRWRTLIPALAGIGKEKREGWLVFASPRAPGPLRDQILRLGGEALGGFEVAAVGRTTARAALKHEFRVSLTGDGTGLGLASELVDRIPQGALVVFACGEDHRRELPETLVRAGHDLIILPVYRMRRLPPAPLPSAAGEIDAVVLTSPRSARYYLENLGGHPPDCLHIALGPTTAAAWRKLGFECSIPARPEMESLAEMLRRI